SASSLRLPSRDFSSEERMPVTWMASSSVAESAWSVDWAFAQCSGLERTKAMADAMAVCLRVMDAPGTGRRTAVRLLLSNPYAGLSAASDAGVTALWKPRDLPMQCHCNTTSQEKATNFSPDSLYWSASGSVVRRRSD